tara:strand:+ start:2957 stop:3457 length:501 start_codon:yes stop_codon:yes gene_type:complete
MMVTASFGLAPIQVMVSFDLACNNTSSMRTKIEAFSAKKIGRCILNEEADGYLDVWNIDYTTKANRLEHGHRRDLKKESGIERRITAHLQANMTFAVVAVPEKAVRMDFEAKMIATVAKCTACCPSNAWLGRQSPVQRIWESGLWQVQGLDGDTLSAAELNQLIGH